MLQRIKELLFTGGAFRPDAQDRLAPMSLRFDGTQLALFYVLPQKVVAALATFNAGDVSVSDMTTLVVEDSGVSVSELIENWAGKHGVRCAAVAASLNAKVEKRPRGWSGTDFQLIQHLSEQPDDVVGRAISEKERVFFIPNPTDVETGLLFSYDAEEVALHETIMDEAFLRLARVQDSIASSIFLAFRSSPGLLGKSNNVPFVCVDDERVFMAFLAGRDWQSVSLRVHMHDEGTICNGISSDIAGYIRRGGEAMRDVKEVLLLDCTTFGMVGLDEAILSEGLDVQVKRLIIPLGGSGVPEYFKALIYG